MTDRTVPSGIAGMQAYQRKVVRETFESIRDQAGPVSLLFYGKLFELAPEARRLFHNDLESIVSSLDNFDGMRERLRELGRQHAGYGVKPGDYETLMVALSWTFAQALGPDYDAAAREAWRVILTEVSETMRSATGSVA